MATISIRGVSKSYEGHPPVLQNISLDIPDGNILTILGPSGCGKSTLLRAIAGLESVDGGEIRIDDVNVVGVDPKDRDLAMVFQSYALYPHMTVRENISVALKLRRVPELEIASRVESAAARLGLGALLQRRPGQLSGGQRQRVAVARAIVRHPKAFLLDEPLSNLDAVLRERTRAELKMLFREIAATVVYVTHDQVEAMTLSDRVAVLNQGRLEQLGAPDELYRRPATVFVAGFVGSPQMNLVDGKQVGDAAEAATVGIRPEDVQISDRPADGERRMRVKMVEPLGAQKLLDLTDDGLDLRALIAADQPVPDEVHVILPRARIHRFDSAGKRI